MMRRPVSRRDFLKITGLGAATVAALRVAPGSVDTRLQTASLPAIAGLSARISTWCSSWPANGAIQVQVAGGKIVDITANHPHPAAAPDWGSFSSSGDLLDDPRRLPGPLGRSADGFAPVRWPAAVRTVAAILQAYRPSEVVFVLGPAADHLSDLVQLIAAALGGASVLRLDAHSITDGRITMLDASQRLYGLPRLPYFDTPHADLVYAIGVAGDEPWVFNLGRRSAPGEWVYFSSLPSHLGLLMHPENWVMIRPGSEAGLARGLALAVSRLRSGASNPGNSLADAAQASGVSIDRLWSLAARFAQSGSAVAVPGTLALSQAAGGQAACAVLALNSCDDRLGKPGSVFLPLDPPLYPQFSRPTSSLAEAAAMIERVHAGQIKAMFVHGVDLLAELPAGLNVAAALQKLEYLVSFNPLHDETASLADLLLPDHLPLESWGYEKILHGVDRPVVAAVQPAVAPAHNTRASADVLLQAVHRLGDETAARLPYGDGLTFIRSAVESLPWEPGEPAWARWLEQGGWWSAEPRLLPPVSLLPANRLQPAGKLPDGVETASAAPLDRLRLLWSPTHHWLTLDGISRLDVHPHTLAVLGLANGQRARLSTVSGALGVTVYADATLWPDILVLSAGRPLDGALPWSALMGLFGGKENASGDWGGFLAEARLEPV